MQLQSYAVDMLCIKHDKLQDFYKWFLMDSDRKLMSSYVAKVHYIVSMVW